VREEEEGKQAYSENWLFACKRADVCIHLLPGLRADDAVEEADGTGVEGGDEGLPVDRHCAIFSSGRLVRCLSFSNMR
jgi:hypothetical protein